MDSILVNQIRLEKRGDEWFVDGVNLKSIKAPQTPCSEIEKVDAGRLNQQSETPQPIRDLAGETWMFELSGVERPIGPRGPGGAP